MLTFLSTTLFLSQNLKDDSVQFKLTDRITKDLYFKVRVEHKIEIGKEEPKVKAYFEYDF